MKNRKVFIVVIMLISILMIACGSRYNDTNESTNDTNEENSSPIDIAQEKTNSLEYGAYQTVPTMYIQDYPDVEIPMEGKTIAENGELIVSLCIIESYLTNTYIEPIDFIKKYGEYIKTSGDVDIDAVAEKMNPEGVYRKQENYDIDFVTQEIEKGSIFLVEIPHQNEFGGSTTFFILNGFTSENYASVRMPNKNNVVKYGVAISTFGDTLFYTADVLTAMGTTATVYEFR